VPRLAPNRADEHSGLALVHIIKNPMLSDTEFPDRLDMFPGWNQAHNNLAIASSPGRFMPQLYLNPIQELPALARGQSAQIISHTL
jgi:hypothetical protein